MSSFSLDLKITIHLTWKAQITILLAKKITTLTEYINFACVFLRQMAKVLLEQININKYTIKLVDNKQLSYKLIYSLKPVEVKTLKTYIEIILANSFIYFLNFPAIAFIFFI